MGDIEVPAQATSSLEVGGRRWEGRYPLLAVADRGWQVTVFPQGERVIRRSVDPQNRLLDEDWHHDTYIWPGWAPRMHGGPVDATSPLQDVHAYWESASSRIRDSAKWMATVIGTTLGFIVGTSPLAHGSESHLRLWTGVLGCVGLLLLVATLMLILRVLLPESVSFIDVLKARDAPGPLHRWRQAISDEPEFYLPCGINSLEGLRQAVKVEELTLMALAAATHHPNVTDNDVMLLQQAEIARANRLRELRDATANIALVGEYYRLRARGELATFLGPICAAIGTMAIIASVALS